MAIIMLIVGVIIAVVFGIIGFFVGNTMLFDSIGLSILAGVTAKNYLPIHPAFALLIGIGVFVLLTLIRQTKIGFWLISLVMSAGFALITATVVYSSTKPDMTWTYVTMGIAFVIFVGLHIKSRDS